MKIAFDPDNMQAAEWYIAKNGIAQPDFAGTWLELAVVKEFVNLRADVKEFTFIYKGIGFFWDVVGPTGAPLFPTGVESKDGDLPDLISVTFWVHADTATIRQQP